MGTWKIPDNLLAENGGSIIREENPDGSVTYKPQDVKYGVGSYTGGAIPDMSRQPGLAGLTIRTANGEWERTYDTDGYCVKMVHLPALPAKEE